MIWWYARKMNTICFRRAAILIFWRGLGSTLHEDDVNLTPSPLFPLSIKVSLKITHPSPV